MSETVWRFAWMLLLASTGAVAVVLGSHADNDAAQCLLEFSGTLLIGYSLLPPPLRRTLPRTAATIPLVRRVAR